MDTLILVFAILGWLLFFMVSIAMTMTDEKNERRLIRRGVWAAAVVDGDTLKEARKGLPDQRPLELFLTDGRLAGLVHGDPSAMVVITTRHVRAWRNGKCAEVAVETETAAEMNRVLRELSRHLNTGPGEMFPWEPPLA